mgnify:CR=1 FL=1
MSRIVCVIPARYESSRFPGKPLAKLLGKPMIQHVYERVLRCPSVHEVVVATDDERIAWAVTEFGGRAVMTAASHRSGTDRIGEAVDGMGLDDDDLVVNIQGDQPLFEPLQVREVTAPLLDDGALLFSTLIYAIRREEEITHPNAVKVVFDRDHFALFFSRATIPYNRGQDRPVYYKHHGIYAYRRCFLPVFSALETGCLEGIESLEQLRALEHGYRIKVIESAYDSLEVDTPQELERVRRILSGEEEPA